MTISFKSNMRAQSWKLNLITAVIATSTTVIASVQESQKKLPKYPRDRHAES